MKDTDIFSGKAVYYDRTRPPYSDDVVNHLVEHIRPGATIADIGAGTGYLTLPLAERGFTMIAIEPNGDLRKALQIKAQSMANIKTRAETAQHTTLPNDCIDALVMGNVAHWLNKDGIREDVLREFNRICRLGAPVNMAFTHPSVTNEWLPSLFELTRSHAPEFDPEEITATFADPSHHVLAFGISAEDKFETSFFVSQDRKGFHEFLYSLSFCNEEMRENIDALFTRFEVAGRVEVQFVSLSYRSLLRPI